MSMIKLPRAVALIGIVASTACAMIFPYKYYPMDYEHGILLGEKEDGSQDKPVTDCAPNGKCIVYFLDEHERLVFEYKRLKLDLEQCRRGKP